MTTTLLSPEGPTEVINARRTESLDAPNILKLVESKTESLFGRTNVVNLIEKAVLAVTLSNVDDDVLGHAAFFDYPNHNHVDPALWKDWLLKYYNIPNCSSLNSLFMHYFVAKPEYSHGCAREIIRTLFNAVPDLNACYLVVPSGVAPETALLEIFKRLKPLGEINPDKFSIYACKRINHVPMLHVRNARVEDNDDLVPIFNRQTSTLTNIYGDFFLNELIEAQSDDMKCIVAEVEGTAVGFMSLSTDINVELLNECFELGPFHGLRYPDDDDELVAPKSPVETPHPYLDDLSTGRPNSACSNNSAASKISATSKPPSPTNTTKIQVQAADNGNSSESLRQPANMKAGNLADDEVKIRSKLSDEKLGGSKASILSDKSDQESIKSIASERNLAKHSEGTKSGPTPKPPTLPFKPPKRFIPKYKGESSAFCIQLFCIDERFEMRSMDFLPKAFELFNTHDYCIITVPHLVPEFPLLQGFMRVTPRSPSTLAQELYVFCKSGLLSDFNVRSACTLDFKGVENLVSSLDLNENLIADLKQFNTARRDDDGTQIQAFVAESFNQIVGVAIIRAEESIEYIRSHYNIEDFIYYNHHLRTEHGHLHHYALNPIFKHYSKQFLKDLLRLAHKTCLYYPLYPAHVDKKVVTQHTLVTSLHDMVPVRARRQIEYPPEAFNGNQPSDRILVKQPTYALNHINRKLTLEPKVTINARVVVIGASDVGIAFLESFAFCPHLRFNNLTLVSPHGLPGELPLDKLREKILSSSQCFTQEDYDQMALRAWVNVVYGKMTTIDRPKKCVVVNGNTLVPYDHLVLTTGLQYMVPAPTEAILSDELSNETVANSPNRVFMGTPPRNCFMINDSFDAGVAMYWAEQNLLTTAGSVIIYGNSLDAYTCIQALTELGVSADRIILAEPPQINEQPTCFNNSDVEAAVSELLMQTGVVMHANCVLAQWNDGDECDLIKNASFSTNETSLTLDCIAFFSYYKKTVDVDAFKAMNDACLVFDGRLVIDANFHTNDVAIRSAGPLTKFQRCYHADQWTHSNFNSKEVGIQLATMMLSLFDPTLNTEPEPPGNLLKLIPMYRSPKIQAGCLPGGLNYLHVAKPGLDVPLETVIGQEEYGTIVKTGHADSEIGYFRLHINQYRSVETITCLTKKNIPSHLICLFGIHERYLNNLISRFEEGLIDDLYSFFSEMWCMAIFHDRFSDFRDEIRELLITRPAANINALEETVRQMVEDDLTLDVGQRKNLSTEFKDSGAKRAVETRLLSFLSYNYYHLPMYAKPGMV